MNFKVTYRELNDESFIQSFQKLGIMKFRPKVSYNLMKIQKKLNSELISLQKLYTELLKKYSELDEKGNVKQIAGPGTYKIKTEHEENYKKESAEILDISFEVENCHKISLTDIETASSMMPPNCRLTPFEFEAIENFVEDDEKPAPGPRPLSVAPSAPIPQA